jgi:hypothetical protein
MQYTSNKIRFFHDYEHKREPLASKEIFIKRIYLHTLLTLLLLFICLSIGVVGYKYGGPMSWIDALHNASMILSGMGPVVEIKTVTGKLFSSFYALFSGVAFISSIGLLVAPLAHRLFHILHAE